MTQPAKPTAKGIVEAMIEAKEASTVCIATKFNPKYRAFWHSPKTMVARHCPGVSRHDCPKNRARAMPITPEIKNRSDRERIGGASATMIRAEENAEDQINANAKPAKIARMSIGCLSLTYRQELRAVSRPEQGYFAQTKAVAQTKARARDPARAFVKN
jgi:hypothetical protein